MELSHQRVASRTPVRSDRPAVRQEFATIFESNDTVASEAPALLGKERDENRRFPVRSLGRGAGGLV
jgi:hypothetical protein